MSSPEMQNERVAPPDLRSILQSRSCSHTVVVYFTCVYGSLRRPVHILRNHGHPSIALYPSRHTLGSLTEVRLENLCC